MSRLLKKTPTNFFANIWEKFLNILQLKLLLRGWRAPTKEDTRATRKSPTRHPLFRLNSERPPGFISCCCYSTSYSCTPGSPTKGKVQCYTIHRFSNPKNALKGPSLEVDSEVRQILQFVRFTRRYSMHFYRLHRT